MKRPAFIFSRTGPDIPDYRSDFRSCVLDVINQRFSVEDDTYSFIVRIWQEADESAAESTAWRGSIEQVGSDQRLYFYDLEGILRFIETQTGITPHRPLIRWRTIWDSIKTWFRKEFLSESGK